MLCKWWSFEGSFGYFSLVKLWFRKLMTPCTMQWETRSYRPHYQWTTVSWKDVPERFQLRPIKWRWSLPDGTLADCVLVIGKRQLVHWQKLHTAARQCWNFDSALLNLTHGRIRLGFRFQLPKLATLSERSSLLEAWELKCQNVSFDEYQHWRSKCFAWCPAVPKKETSRGRPTASGRARGRLSPKVSRALISWTYKSDCVFFQQLIHV